MTASERIAERVGTWARWFVDSIPDGLALLGAVSLSYGAWLVYVPAGYIVGGVLLIVGGVIAARASS